MYNRGEIVKTAQGYIGSIDINGVEFNSIVCTFWNDKDKKHFIWIKRNKELKYNPETKGYEKYDPKPKWSAILYKTKDKAIPYKGEFIFARFKYDIKAFWEDKTQSKLHLSVERSDVQPL